LAELLALNILNLIMQSKSLLIAIAAFAVTTTGVSAYGGKHILRNAGLNDNQIEAMQEARELRHSGDQEAARDRLLDAGIDVNILRNIHKASKEARSGIHNALETDDYESFKKAIESSSLADIITSEADFEQFQEAHALRMNGDWEEAEEILDELGIERKENRGHFDMSHKRFLKNLNEEQRDALKVAKQSNDKKTVRAILDEAGIETGPRMES
jgi:DNA-directed RNA polymerase subunit N (RpoN/RPB10)